MARDIETIDWSRNGRHVWNRNFSWCRPCGCLVKLSRQHIRDINRREVCCGFTRGSLAFLKTLLLCI
jgi:hypothetical protein